jgi:glycyl-tRNA synthetase beta chain
VIRPRLADAAFFWETDRRRPLITRLAELDRVVFEARLGSLGDKTRRVRKLVASIAPEVGADLAAADRAAELAKCDLVCSMVGEFPELQGTMGTYYARLDGESEAVAGAIAEHYLPRFAGDHLPTHPIGIAVAIADRLDTLVGIFAIGQKPTGTRDPYGLRRGALGILRILVEQRIELDFVALLETAAAAVRRDMSRVADGPSDHAFARDDSLVADVYDYVMERLRSYYLDGRTDGSVTTEMFDAVLATRPRSPLDFDARLKALRAFLALPDAASLAAANKRIQNILRKANAAAREIDDDRLVDPAERILAEQVVAIERQIAPLRSRREYTELLRSLAVLRPAVDGFFEDVMVMVEDQAVRDNRLALLTRLSEMFQSVADLSRLSS